MKPLTNEQILSHFPNASRSTLARNQTINTGTCPIVECVVSNEPLATPQAQASDSGRYIVRVVSYRCRLLDEDNLAEKYHVDACRYAGLIPADSPDKTHIEVTQQKVKTKGEERTELLITKL